MEQTRMHFDGDTYDPKLDYTRLTTQLGKVYNFLNSGRWYTLRELANLVQAPEASVSARLRDLRKPKFGEHNIEHERLSNGVWRYRMISTSTADLQPQTPATLPTDGAKITPGMLDSKSDLKNLMTGSEMFRKKKETGA